MTWILIIYFVCFGLVTYFSIREQESIAKTLSFMIFIPIVVVWELVYQPLDGLMRKLLKNKLKKNFGINNLGNAKMDARTKFLFPDNYIILRFVVWVYILFGLKINTHNKNR